MSRVISSSPSFVERASISYSWMWIDVRMSSFTSRSLSTIASSKLKPSNGMNATRRFAPSASSPCVGRAAVGEHLARRHLVAELDDRLVVDERALVRAHELRSSSYSSRAVLRPRRRPCRRRRRRSCRPSARRRRRRSRPRRGTRGRCRRAAPARISSGTACRCMFAPMSARFASLCSRNGISAVETDTICAGETSISSTSFGRRGHGLALGGAAEDGSSMKRLFLSSSALRPARSTYCVSSTASR